MNQTHATVITRGFALPALLGRELAGYCDRCAESFGPLGGWRDSWSDGRVRTLGLDLGMVRLRFVLARVQASIEARPALPSTGACRVHFARLPEPPDDSDRLGLSSLSKGSQW